MKTDDKVRDYSRGWKSRERTQIKRWRRRERTERGGQKNRKERKRQGERRRRGAKGGGDPCSGPGPKQLTSGEAPGHPTWQGEVDRDMSEDITSWWSSTDGLPSLCSSVQLGDFSDTSEQLICVAD